MTVDLVDVSTGEIVPAFGGALTPDQASARATWVREVTKAALTEEVDYGKIPGTERPTLFKSGAEMLLLAAGYGFDMDRWDDDDVRTHRGVTYKCTVRRRDGSTVSTCDGYAGYDESRFFTSAEEAEQRERFNANKYKRPVNQRKFVEYRAPWNTLVKMAQKRALVGAALNACAASGLFIADLDDASPTTPEPVPEPSPASDPVGSATDIRGGSGADDPEPPEGTAELADVLAGLAKPQRDAFRSWRRSKGWEWPPANAEQLHAMSKEVDRLLDVENEETETYG
jgi:hypothetical protein